MIFQHSHYCVITANYILTADSGSGCAELPLNNNSFNFKIITTFRFSLVLISEVSNFIFLHGPRAHLYVLIPSPLYGWTPFILMNSKLVTIEESAINIRRGVAHFLLSGNAEMTPNVRNKTVRGKECVGFAYVTSYLFWHLLYHAV